MLFESNALSQRGYGLLESIEGLLQLGANTLQPNDDMHGAFRVCTEAALQAQQTLENSRPKNCWVSI